MSVRPKTIKGVIETQFTKYLYQIGTFIFIVVGIWFFYKGENNGLEKVNASEKERLKDCNETVAKLEKRIYKSDSATAAVAAEFKNFILTNFKPLNNPQ